MDEFLRDFVSLGLEATDVSASAKTDDNTGFSANFPDKAALTIAIRTAFDDGDIKGAGDIVLLAETKVLDVVVWQELGKLLIVIEHLKFTTLTTGH